MKALVWKELRENFKWAVLAMIGLGLAETYGLSATGYNDDPAAPLCKTSFLMTTSLGCAVVGIILGLMQILPEQRRDLWASMLHRPLHRPLHRKTILRGKVIAGLILYSSACLLPYLACVWYVAVPGHYAAPFVPQTVYVGLIDIFVGTTFYFAAIFAGLRRGNWFGARSFGFLAAALATLFVNANNMAVALGVSAFVAVTLFIADAGAIRTNGRLRDQPWHGRIATVAVVLTGTICLGGIAILLLSITSAQDYPYNATSYDVGIDGTVLKIVTSRDSGTRVTDLTGNAIEDKRYTVGSRYDYIIGFSGVCSSIGDAHRSKDQLFDLLGYRQSGRYVRRAAGSYDSDNEVWYYLPRQSQFVGYLSKKKERIGAIGLDGFHPGYQPAASLGELRTDVYSPLSPFVQFDSTVYHSDFDQRKLTVIFSQPGTPVYGSTPLRSNQDRTVELNWCAVAALDKMLVVDKTGQTVATLPFHQDMDHWGKVSIGVNPGKDRFFLQYQPSEWIEPNVAVKIPSYIEELDAKGTLLNTYTLPPVPWPDYPASWQQILVESLAPPVLYSGVLATEKIAALCGSEVEARELAQNWDEAYRLLLRITVISLVLAVITLRWALRLDISPKRARSWALFVLAFNLAGLVTFRLIADWPVRVRCPRCERKRPVEEARCPHCHTPWPTPERTGIEIFDDKESGVSQPTA
jgi:hypothetical protein